jgi:hypothetical protein
MDLQSRVVAEMQRRAALLPQEVSDWQAKASQNIDALGIHRSQFNALKLMMDERGTVQIGLLAGLAPGQPAQAFSDAYQALTAEIVGINSLWGLFRTIIDQNQNSTFEETLDAANLVAADCYNACMERAVEWKVATESETRPPPLVYLNASTSPVTVSRGKKIELLDDRILHGDMVLPIPVIRLPYDHIPCVWLLCAVHHEVGHNIDQELQLSSELSQLIANRLPQMIAQAGADLPDRIGVWQGWTKEILADVFGVLLAGAAFGYTMASLLLPMAPQFPLLRRGKPHPDSYVRVVLLAEMLRKCGVAQLKETADFISQQWFASQTPPAWTKSYRDDCPAIAELFLNTPLAALTANGTSHKLREIVPDLAGDATKAADLGRYLRSAAQNNGAGFNRPDPKKFPYRLVPVAAQLAYQQLGGASAAILQQLQASALQFLKDIERPEFLDGPVDRDEHLKALTARLDFGVLFEDDEDDSP